MTIQPEAAVAILHARLPVDSILLIRRATNPKDPWSGHWAFPGGRRDPRDSDLLDTAIRELREECNIDIGREQLTRQLPYASVGRRVGLRIWVAPFGFEIPEALPTTLAPAEAVEALWAPIPLLADLTRHTRMPIPGLPQDVHWPAIPLSGVPLWGFTYRIICSWIGVEVPPDA